MRRHLVASALPGLAFCATAHSHHSRVNFLNETVAFEGEVAGFDFANPHSHIYVVTHELLVSGSVPAPEGPRYRLRDGGATLTIDFAIEEPEHRGAPAE